MTVAPSLQLLCCSPLPRACCPFILAVLQSLCQQGRTRSCRRWIDCGFCSHIFRRLKSPHSPYAPILNTLIRSIETLKARAHYESLKHRPARGKGGFPRPVPSASILHRSPTRFTVDSASRKTLWFAHSETPCQNDWYRISRWKKDSMRWRVVNGRG